jgi:hypothetical protein
MPTEAQQRAFMVGWYRSRHTVNLATRLQARKAQNDGCLEQFIQGWLIQQLLCVMFEGSGSLRKQDMGLPARFYQHD